MGRWGTGFGDRPGQDANAAGPREFGADPKDFDFPELNRERLAADGAGEEAGAGVPADTDGAEDDYDAWIAAEEAACAAAAAPAPETVAELRARAEHDGGADDDGDAGALSELRQRRLAELRRRREEQQRDEEQRAAAPRGELRHLRSQEEYTDAVMGAAEGAWVVCLLVADGDADCEALRSVLRVVAERHPHVRFVSARAREAVPSLPASQLPTVLLRAGGAGAGAKQVAGMGPWGARRPDPETVERRLEEWGLPVTPSAPARAQYASDSDGDSDGAGSRARAGGAAASKFSLY